MPSASRSGLLLPDALSAFARAWVPVVAAVIWLALAAEGAGSSGVVVAHRGMPFEVPENTLESVAAAVDAGVTAIEIDVRKTSDGHFVLMHDTTVDRTTNGTGEIRFMSLSQVQELDAGYDFKAPSYPFRGAGLRVPTLAQVMAQCLPGRVTLVIDVKDVGVGAEARAIADTLGFPYERLTFLGFERGFNSNTLPHFPPGTVPFWSYTGKAFAAITEAEWGHYQAAGTTMVWFANGSLAPEDIALAHGYGLKVGELLGNPQNIGPLLDSGIDRVMVDHVRPTLAAAALRAWQHWRTQSGSASPGDLDADTLDELSEFALLASPFVPNRDPTLAVDPTRFAVSGIWDVTCGIKDVSPDVIIQWQGSLDLKNWEPIPATWGASTTRLALPPTLAGQTGSPFPAGLWVRRTIRPVWAP